MLRRQVERTHRACFHGQSPQADGVTTVEAEPHVGDARQIPARQTLGVLTLKLDISGGCHEFFGATSAMPCFGLTLGNSQKMTCSIFVSRRGRRGFIKSISATSALSARDHDQFGYFDF
jgi:hypothetical protein